jgi:gas vesicle protein
MSEYKSKGDKKFADLKQAKNDVHGMTDLILDFELKFKKENIKTLLNSTHQELKEAMKKFYENA